MSVSRSGAWQGLTILLNENAGIIFFLTANSDLAFVVPQYQITIKLSIIYIDMMCMLMHFQLLDRFGFLIMLSLQI